MSPQGHSLAHCRESSLGKLGFSSHSINIALSEIINFADGLLLLLLIKYLGSKKYLFSEKALIHNKNCFASEEKFTGVNIQHFWLINHIGLFKLCSRSAALFTSTLPSARPTTGARTR